MTLTGAAIMHPRYPDNPPASLLSISSIAAGLVWWSMNLKPPLVGSQIDWFSAFIYFMAALFCLQTVIRLLENLSHYIDLLGSRKVSGQKGTSAWATAKEFEDGLSKDKRGPFWGRFAGTSSRTLFFDFVSNAVSIGPAGSSKTISTVSQRL